MVNRRRKHTVQIVCSNCKSTYAGRATSHLCPQCRLQKPSPPRDKTKPNWQKPIKENNQQRPHKGGRPGKKPYKPGTQSTSSENAPTHHQTTVDTNVAPATSNSSRIANRTTRSSAPLKPGRTIVSAVQRLLMMVLDPAGTVGQRAVRLNVDEIAAPKYPVQFDCNFQITGSEFKLLLASSPLISCVLWDPSGDTAVIGAESYKIAGDNGFYTYVINNKRNLITESVGQLVVESKEDFRRFRMIASSMQMQWSGQEIFKNGIYNIARLTDKEDLAEFMPNNKIDSVIANVSDVIVCTSQRITPNAPLIPIDRTADDAGGTRPGGHDKGYEKLIITAGLPGALELPTQTYSFANNTTFNGICTAIQGAQSAWYTGLTTQSIEYKRIFDTFISQLVAKYPEFYNPSSQTYNCTAYAEMQITATMAANTYQTFNVSQQPSTNLFSTTNTSFHEQLTAALAASTPTTQLIPNATGSKPFVFRQTITLVIPINGKFNQRVQIPNFLSLGVDENALADTIFYDDGFLEPVVHCTGGLLQIQVTTSHSFEFLLADDTVLAAAAVANTPKDPEAVISRSDYNRFQRIMKGMPPALIQGDLGLSRVSTQQLASRGILSDVINTLGNMVSSILPQHSYM